MVAVDSVVTKDVVPFSVVIGAPANFVKWRQGYVEEEDHGSEE